MPATPPDVMLRAALALALGWEIFPAPMGAKKSYKSARYSGGRKWGRTRDPNEIKADWARWRHANIGVPCGLINGFWVLETDTLTGGHAYDGEVSLIALIAAHGALPLTRMARSPSGSIHYYFRWPRDGGLDIKNTAGRIGPGIDVRGEGGMVIAPPSNRPDERGGGCYEWLNSEDIAEAPEWLVELAREATRAATTAQEQRESDATHCDLERLEAALEALPNPLPQTIAELNLRGGWEDWNAIGMAIYAATGGSSFGLRLFRTWSAKCSAKHDDGRTDEKWRKFSTCPPINIGAGLIFKIIYAIDHDWERISFNDFWSCLPNRKYLFTPTTQMWVKDAVDGCLPMVDVGLPRKIKPHAWLDKHRAIHHLTWSPGLPRIIEHKLLSEEGVWRTHRGSRTYNFYKAPTLIPGDARLAGPWLDLVDQVIGDERPHVVAWMAHRVQRPHEKINHALVIGGPPGIGKDSMLEPLKRAVGAHNFQETDPQRLIKPYNKFLQAVVLRISEARDLGDMSQFRFYDHIKTYTASPPDVLKIEEKYEAEYAIANVVGLILTTNYRDGLYIPHDDRRYHVSWSDACADDIDDDYFDQYWTWLNGGGDGHVLAWLRDLDISQFNPKEPPSRTAMFEEMVVVNQPAELDDVANVINVGLGSPEAFTFPEFIGKVPLDGDLHRLVERPGGKKMLSRRFAELGYSVVRNPDNQEGIWRICGHRQMIYALANLTRDERVEAARRFIARAEAAAGNVAGDVITPSFRRVGSIDVR